MATPIESPYTFSAEPFDAQIDRLVSHKDRWCAVPLTERIAYLKQCIRNTVDAAETWVDLACHAKGINPDSALAGEEWITGPMALCRHMRVLSQSLQQNAQPQPAQLYRRSTEQWVARVFPATSLDRVLWLGLHADVWIEPGHPPTQGKAYTQQKGVLALVLGAGNLSSIGASDMLHKLFVENQVAILKMNPVNAYLGPLLEMIFQPLVEANVLAIVYGDAEVGCYLCHHPQIETVHLTGSHLTHDAIVWGAPEEQAGRKATNDPRLSKPITSELGCVTPVMIVPGTWSEADLLYHARQVASMVAHNAGFNCTAARVLITARGWSQRRRFLQLVRQELARVPCRSAYYPGSEERYRAFLAHYPQAQPVCTGEVGQIPWTVIPNVRLDASEYALQTEAFCGVLAEVTLQVETAKQFLEAVVPLVNTQIWGTLSCMILIDDRMAKTHRPHLEQAIADLRYGAIAVNLWSAVVYSLFVTTWGGYPGSDLRDIQSGQGVVHNTLMFDHPQKSVVRAPFRLLLTPPWFVTHRNLKAVGRALMQFEVDPSWWKAATVIWATLHA